MNNIISSADIQIKKCDLSGQVSDKKKSPESQDKERADKTNQVKEGLSGSVDCIDVEVVLEREENVGGKGHVSPEYSLQANNGEREPQVPAHNGANHPVNHPVKWHVGDSIIADPASSKDKFEAAVYGLWSADKLASMSVPIMEACKAATAGVGPAFALMGNGFSAIDACLAVKNFVDARTDSKELDQLLNQNKASHDGFERTAKELVVLRGDLETLQKDLEELKESDGSETEKPRMELLIHAQLDLIRDASEKMLDHTPGWLAYNAAMSKRQGKEQALSEAVVALSRDFGAQGAGIGAGLAGTVTTLSTGGAVANAAAGVVGGVCGLVGSILHIVAAGQKTHKANSDIKRAERAMERADKIIDEKGKLDLRLMKDLDKAEGKRNKREPYLKDGDQKDKAHLDAVYQGLTDTFKNNQQQAIDKARGDKRFAVLRKWTGVTGVGLGAAALAAAVLGGATMGIGLAIAGAVLGAIWLGVTAWRKFRGNQDKDKANKVEAQQKKVVEDLAKQQPDMTVKQLEDLFNKDEHRGNKFMAAQLLAQHALDDREERTADGQPVRTDGTYFRRKAADSWLRGVLGMKAVELKATKAQIRRLREAEATAPDGDKQAATQARQKAEKAFVDEIKERLLGDAARRDESKPRSLWTRFTDYFRELLMLDSRSSTKPPEARV